MEISASLPLDQSTPLQFEVLLLGQEGDEHLVNFVLASERGSMLLATRWRNASGVWKIDDIALKQ
jgi:hypothetical protein